MLRKFIRFALIAAAVYFVNPLRPAFAGTLESDLRSKTVVLHSSWTVNPNISTNVVLISLSSTTVWPNPTNETGFINITNIYMNLDKLGQSSCTVKLGVVTFVDSSSGSVKYFFSLLNARASAGSTTTVTNAFYEADNSFRCLKVIPIYSNPQVDGITPYLISNDLVSGSTLYQTDVALPSVNIYAGGMMNPVGALSGNIAPSLGDIIMSVVNFDAVNAITVTIDMTYHYGSR